MAHISERVHTCGISGAGEVRRFCVRGRGGDTEKHVDGCASEFAEFGSVEEGSDCQCFAVRRGYAMCECFTHLEVEDVVLRKGAAARPPLCEGRWGVGRVVEVRERVRVGECVGVGESVGDSVRESERAGVGEWVEVRERERQRVAWRWGGGGGLASAGEVAEAISCRRWRERV